MESSFDHLLLDIVIIILSYSTFKEWWILDTALCTRYKRRDTLLEAFLVTEINVNLVMDSWCKKDFKPVNAVSLNWLIKKGIQVISWQNNTIDDKELKAISFGLPMLRSIYLYNCSDSGLSKSTYLLKMLNSLYIYGCFDISDTGILSYYSQIVKAIS